MNDERDEITISEAVRERLAVLEQDGRLTPADVVNDAKSKDSPLHDLFEWDNRKAADAHRLDTARVVIRSVRYLGPPETVTTVRGFQYVRDPDAPGNVQGYVSVRELRRDPAAAWKSLRLEFGRVESALQRARAVADTLDLGDEVEDLIVRLIRVQSRLAERVRVVPDGAVIEMAPPPPG